MTEISYKVFHDAIEAQGSTLLRMPLVSMRGLLLYFLFHYPLSQELDDVSVTPPLVILDHVQILREIMTVYQHSLLDEDSNGEQTARFQGILDVMIDPAVEMCTVAGEAKKQVKQNWDLAVFVLNCLSYLQVCSFIYLHT